MCLNHYHYSIHRHLIEDSLVLTTIPRDITSRYRRAEQYLQEGFGAKRLVNNTHIIPHWIKGSDCFWYLHESRPAENLIKTYRLYNAEQQTQSPAFDHQALADALAVAATQEVNSEALPITGLEFNWAAQTLGFNAFDGRWLFDLNSHHCEKVADHSPGWLLSPNGRYAAFVRESNIWLRDRQSGEERALTTDGHVHYSYGTIPVAFGTPADDTLDALWSPDSSRLLTPLIDRRNIAPGLPLMQYAPRDGSLQSRLIDPDRKVARFQDEHVERWQLLSIEVATGKQQCLEHTPCAVIYPHYAGYFGANLGWWDNDSRQAYAIYQDRDSQDTRLLKWDTHTGQCETLFEELPEQRVTLIPGRHNSAIARALPDTGELIWWSERSGWGHLYLIDLSTGKVKTTLTQGDFVVRNILHVDAVQREMIIQTAGRGSSANPYYRDICKVQMDSGELTELVGSDHDYLVANSGSSEFYDSSPFAGVSPDGRYLVATRNRVDQAAVSTLYSATGQPLAVVDKVDLSHLPEDWQWPEPVILKGADQQTDIYGIIFRPSDFSAQQSYPVVDLSFSYCGPTGMSFRLHYFMGQALAELGFIAVRFDNRGEGLRRNAGLRDRAFNQFRDTSVPFHNMADNEAAIRQLCEQHRYMDVDRVGVMMSSMASALTGLLIYPELYKVGVALNVQGDNSLYPFDLGGMADFPPYTDFVHQLKGKLLLIQGMLDDAYSVAGTFQVIDALHQAHQSFDMLLLPNMTHLGSSYATKRGWDYLVTHLLGIEPPQHLRLSGVCFCDD